ncbi:MAG: hypothetical protein E7535_07590 [Ruminococcaceae bacterium]|nr:hypothetical protein [Oscillospiraceae bacterium]
MKKTKIGLSLNVFCSMIFLIAFLGGYVPTIMIVGYTLLCEKERCIKVTALNALFLLFAFSCFDSAIAIIPYLYGFVDNFVSLFGGYCDTRILATVTNALSYIVDIARTVIFIVISLRIFKGKQTDIAVITKLTEKYLILEEKICEE